MIFKKRAVSPLIATVLLISFAVALGAVVMAFGSRTFEPSRSCSAVDLKISSACYDTQRQKIVVNLDNKGEIDVDSSKLWVVGDSVFKIDLKDSIAKGTSLREDVEYNYGTYGDIKTILAIPSIKKRDQVVPCPDNAASVQQVGTC